MTNREPRLDAAELDKSVNLKTMESVVRDFAALVAVLEQQLKLAPLSDDESRSHLQNAKAAAERGVQLTEQLLSRIRSAGATARNG